MELIFLRILYQMTADSSQPAFFGLLQRFPDFDLDDDNDGG